MRHLGYDEPGSPEDLERFKEGLAGKSKAELLAILGSLAEACDEGGKGYVNEWEGTVRHIIGYTRGHGLEHAKECGCPRCCEERR
jgi:hypothetical protein